MIIGVSLDFWGTIAKPNPKYSTARTAYFAELFGVEPEVAHAKYVQIKRHADYAAEHFGTAYHPMAQIRSLLNCEKLTRKVDACDVYYDLMHRVARYKPVISPSMKALLKRASPLFVMGITSNTNFIPGHVLASLIPSTFAEPTWSDVVGICKPSPEIFNQTYRSLVTKNGAAIKPWEILHIGDNYRCDYVGATRFGFQGRHVKSVEETEAVLQMIIDQGELE
jgi:FMN phosphatase YigB (HAD superfamily)